MRQLNVLVACEESGRVRDAFRELGHNAWSCDLQPCDPDSKFSDYHLQGSVLDFLDRRYQNLHIRRNVLWKEVFKPKHIDIMIAHPPCTYLCNSGVRWLFTNTSNATILTRRVTAVHGQPLCGLRGWITRPANTERVTAMRKAAEFFKKLWEQPEIPWIAIENPIMHSYAADYIGAKATQFIQPWMFGVPTQTNADGSRFMARDMESKATGLWLKGLPKLKPHFTSKPTGVRQSVHRCPPGPDRAKIRSRTFPGIALAMAEQWGEYVSNLPLA